MTIVDLIKNGFDSKDWSLISQAYELLIGESLSKKEAVQKMIDNRIPAHRADQPQRVVHKTSAMENKFVDDLTLESHLIENNPKARKKVYREPFSENNLYTTVNCVQCGNAFKVTKEEVRFRKSSSESSDFTCIRCMRGSK